MDNSQLSGCFWHQTIRTLAVISTGQSFMALWKCLISLVRSREVNDPTSLAHKS